MAAWGLRTRACVSRSRWRALEVPRLGETGIDALALAAAAAAVSATGCGLPPAWRASRTAPTAVLKVDARTKSDGSAQRLGDLHFRGAEKSSLSDPAC